MKKFEFCEIFSRNLWQKKFNEISRQCILSLNVKSTTFSWKIMKFYQNWQNFSQKFLKKGEWNQRNSIYFLESLNWKVQYLPVKNENQKNFNFIFYAGQAF